MNAERILARLEKLRYAWLDYGDRPMVFSRHLDAAIADIRGYLQEPVTVGNRVTSVNTDCWPDGPQMPDYEEEIAEAEADAAMADAEGDAEYGEANGAK